MLPVFICTAIKIVYLEVSIEEEYFSAEMLWMENTHSYDSPKLADAVGYIEKFIEFQDRSVWFTS